MRRMHPSQLWKPNRYKFRPAFPSQLRFNYIQGMPRISIVGIGRVGGALALVLDGSGYQIDHLLVRGTTTAERIVPKLTRPTTVGSLKSASEIDSDVIIIATADPDISIVAEQLADFLSKPSIVIHTSGSLSSEVLSRLEEVGCPTGSMHPLVSISDAISGASNFHGAYFCVEGDPTAVEAAEAIVRELGGKSFSINAEQKSLYHAAAVTACGHLVALIDVAIEMLSKCGLEPAKAKQILMPLIKSTIANLETQSPSEALTGTFARADFAAFARHLESISKNTSSEAKDIYLLLGRRSIDLAERNGADPSRVAMIRKSISIAKEKSE